jgi:hypothetical protein
MGPVIAYPTMVALLSLGSDFRSALRNLFDSLVSMREAAKKNGKIFDAWFVHVTHDDVDGVWLETLHADSIPLRWGRFDPMTMYHLFVKGEGLCSPQLKEEDVSHWMSEENINDTALCVRCYRKAMEING